MPAAVATVLGVAAGADLRIDEALGRSAPASPREACQSALRIEYGAAARQLGGAPWSRALERFDFAEEWNNLGFGAVRLDGGIWAVAHAWQAPAAAELARLVDCEGRGHGSYAALVGTAASALLWFNRPVGPIDSVEWRLVENFLSAHGAGALPCMPVLREVPLGHDAAVTMRLDCDEDVASARALFEACTGLDVPFSLAVHTATLEDTANHRILCDVLARGGAVLSHSATHAANWGGSAEAAMREAGRSARAIADVTGSAPRHAVSPFHQTPFYALEALAACGYQGCIGGIIGSDPEFLMARGGAMPGLPAGFVGHAQQCMLHGDCMAGRGDPLRVHKQAFDLAFAGATLFGYLDHPFSQRYSYGWTGEAERIAAHEALVAHIRTTARAPLFLNEDDALDFLRFKAAARVTRCGARVSVATPAPAPRGLGLAVDYAGACLPAADLGARS
jgi:hypothetical protein